MEITIGPSHPEGMVPVTVDYYEQIDDLGYSARVEVFVPDSDSRSEIRATAMVAARDFLERAIAAHDH